MSRATRVFPPGNRNVLAMAPTVGDSVETISRGLSDLAEWVRVRGGTNELNWFQEASVEAMAELTELRKLTANVAEVIVRNSIGEATFPSLVVASEVADRLMKISRLVQAEVINKTEDRVVKDSAGKFVGSLYVDVIWPLHRRYPALIPDDMKDDK